MARYRSIWWAHGGRYYCRFKDKWKIPESDWTKTGCADKAYNRANQWDGRRHKAVQQCQIHAAKIMAMKGNCTAVTRLVGSRPLREDGSQECTKEKG